MREPELDTYKLVSICFFPLAVIFLIGNPQRSVWGYARPDKLILGWSNIDQMASVNIGILVVHKTWVYRLREYSLSFQNNLNLNRMHSNVCVCLDGALA